MTRFSQKLEDLEARVAKLEERQEKNNDKIDDILARLIRMEDQVGRLTSHIESEVGTTNRLVNDLDKKLFGEPKDEYGGRIGNLSKSQHKFELRLAYGLGGAGVMWFIIEHYDKISKLLK